MTTITVYSSRNCGACAEVVPAIQALARRKGIPVKIIDVDNCGKPCDFVEYTPLIKIGNREVSAVQLSKILT